MKKIMKLLPLAILLTGLFIYAFSNEIKCVDPGDNCGSRCPHGMCVDAAKCKECVIENCLNDETGKRENVPCSSYPQ